MAGVEAATKKYWLNQFPQGANGQTTVNPQVFDRRIGRKIDWAKNNTMVFVEWRNAKRAAGRQHLIRQGPTYNPADYDPTLFTYPVGKPIIPYETNQVGWQDPVTVHVYHRFGLMPGLGALLRHVQRSWSFQHRHNQGVLVDPNAWDEFMTQGARDYERDVDVFEPETWREMTREQRKRARRHPGVFVIHASATMSNQGVIPIYGEAIDEF